MISKKLTDLLESFTKYELNRFRKFLCSPYFNDQENLTQLFDLLDKSFRNKYVHPTKKDAWKAVFRHEAYDEVRFRRLCSDLGLLAGRFLSLQAIGADGWTESLFLLRELNQRNLDKHFNFTEKQARKDLNKNHQNDSHFLNSFLLEKELDTFQIKLIQRTRKRNLSEADSSLNNFYIARKLKHYCDALNYKNVLNVDVEIGLIEPILHVVRKEGYLEVPSIAIYYTAMMTLVEPDEEKHFFSLNNLLNKHQSVFPTTELRELYIYAQNYCIRNINAGKTEFLKSLFSIFKELLDTGIIFIENQLLPWDYKNMITLGLRLKEYDWTEQFIIQNHSRLPDDFQKNALIYNTAMVYFHKKEYSKVIEQLSNLEYQDVYYAVDGRWLLLKTYYELSEMDALDALLESFRLFLLRQKLISKNNQKQYLNLVRFVQKLNKLNVNDLERVKTFRNKVEQSENIAEKQWLLEKVDELI